MANDLNGLHFETVGLQIYVPLCNVLTMWMCIVCHVRFACTFQKTFTIQMAVVVVVVVQFISSRLAQKWTVC